MPLKIMTFILIMSFCCFSYAQSTFNKIMRFISIIESEETKNQTLFLRKDDIIYNIFGFNSVDKEKLKDKISILAREHNLNSNEGYIANLHIIADKNLFKYGVFIEPDEKKSMFTQEILDRLRDRWVKRLNCVYGSDHWGTDRIGFSMVLLNPELKDEEKWACINFGLFGSFGYSTGRIVKCLAECFEKPIVFFDIRVVVQSINKCEIEVQEFSKLEIYEEKFFTCFWDDYRKNVKS